ncbi:hypothetical protein PLESTM_001363600 [Pleodorina starrii]|nr:hypothetical protein PLESTM_001363600 [Pleodorina starrii]
MPVAPNDTPLAFIVGNFRYDVRQDRLSFAAAEAACIARGGHLASFQSAEEWAAVEDVVRVSTLMDTLGTGTSLQLWIGLRLELSYMSWTDGQPLSYIPTDGGGIALLNGACYTLSCSEDYDAAVDGGGPGRACGLAPALPLESSCDAPMDGFLCKTDLPSSSQVDG